MEDKRAARIRQEVLDLERMLGESPKAVTSKAAAGSSSSSSASSSWSTSSSSSSSAAATSTASGVTEITSSSSRPSSSGIAEGDAVGVKPKIAVSLHSASYSFNEGGGSEEMKSEALASPRLHGKPGPLYNNSGGTLLEDTRMPSLLALDSRRRLVQLPRGGTLVETRYGEVQFGCPPNTLKDCMKLGITIPTVYIIPGRIFDTQSKIAAAEIEFPAYFNYFMLKKQVTFVATKSQAERLTQVLRETLVGPEEIDLEAECAATMPKDQIPNLYQECAAIRTFTKISDLVQFKTFDDEGVADLENGLLVKKSRDGYTLIEDGEDLVNFPNFLELPRQAFARRMSLTRPYDPPQLGITILGSSHGFDPHHSTTGFVLWINGRGIMVDPPLHSSALLQKNGIPSRVVDAIIITHCHADHDAGALQKILDEGKIRVITTPTIMNSFVRKYSAMLDEDGVFLRRLFTFQAVELGEPVVWRGAELRFHYSVHTIPAIGFELYYSGKSIFYSGDTCNDIKILQDLKDRGIMPKARFEKLTSFAWHHSVILHEAGVPPIHTPIDVFRDLPEDVKERLYLVHTTADMLQDCDGLKIAKEGVQNSIVLPVVPNAYLEAYNILEIVSQVEIFSSLTAAQTRDILLIAHKAKYKGGSAIIELGKKGDNFFVIARGVVSIFFGSKMKHLIAGDFFGEMALVTDEPRSATCIARTEVEVVYFKKTDFLSLIRGNQAVIKRIMHLAKMRMNRSWDILTANSIFSTLTNNQKEQLQKIMVERKAYAGLAIWQRENECERVIIVDRGCFMYMDENMKGPDRDIMNGGPSTRLLKRRRSSIMGSIPLTRAGTFIGEVSAILGNGKHTTTLMSMDEGIYFEISLKDLLDFFECYPGVQLSLSNTLSIGPADNMGGMSEDSIMF